MKDAKGHGSNPRGIASVHYKVKDPTWTGTVITHGSSAKAKGVHAAGIAALPTKQVMQKAAQETATSRELKLFGDNDGNLYRQSQQPIERNLLAKAAKGVYDHALATKLWGYHADRAAQAYHRQFGSPGTSWHTMFSTSDRRAAATQWANSFKSEHNL